MRPSLFIFAVLGAAVAAPTPEAPSTPSPDLAVRSPQWTSFGSLEDTLAELRERARTENNENPWPLYQEIYKAVGGKGFAEILAAGLPGVRPGTLPGTH